ncbi:MAG: hypothetical protein K2X60_13110 [Xanthobacteraceae bacterium]|nr:hypothetical protein [Xanthobacteraceae bacterium]
MNLFRDRRDQAAMPVFRLPRAGLQVKIIKPNKNDPILLHSPKPGIATILIRFFIFLGLAVVILTLAWLK